MSLKFGVILAAYNSSGTIDKCLENWLPFVEYGNIKIHAISIPFKEYESIKIEEDNTVDILKEYKVPVETKPRYIDEAHARNLAFGKLKGDCDYVWILDADELYKTNEILSIIRFVSLNGEIDSFNINFKNYVFDGDCWVDGFCPPRIFKTKNAKGFYWDNDMSYDINNQRVSYRNLSQMVIPKNVAHVKHLTWINNQNSKNKVKYQEKHFGSGAGCSYKWNDEKNCLEFNEDYFKKTGEAKPKLNYD